MSRTDCEEVIQRKQMSANQVHAKWTKPRVMCVDMNVKFVEALRQAGFNVTTGSFGSPVEHSPNGKLREVEMDGRLLENIEEQEVFFLNTAPRSLISGAGRRPKIGEEFPACYGTDGYIDPRPLVMKIAAETFDRIRKHGGIFFVFLGKRYVVEYQTAEVDTLGYVHPKRGDASESLSNWEVLPVVESLWHEERSGTEITFKDRVLERGAGDAKYFATIAPSEHQAKCWTVLGEDKYGHAIAGMLTYESFNSRVVLLPQMPNAADIAVPLLAECCAEWNPDIFPHHGVSRWKHNEAYELPEVTAKLKQIKVVQERAESEVQQLEGEIQDIREDNANWYALLDGTDSELVQAIIDALKQVGFAHVVDVDEVEPGVNLREDIQVLDGEPPLVIDVKGIGGLPTDADCTQAIKHAHMRTRDMKTWCKALTIINSQRKVPPKERNSRPFRPEIVDAAIPADLGLMTSWDVFKLVRNKRKLNWPNSALQPIFYKSGRILAVPCHYEVLGKLSKVHPRLQCVEIKVDRAVHVGSKVAIEINDEFHELDIASIQINDAGVSECVKGDLIGLKVSGAVQGWKEGMVLYAIEL